jgi:glycine/D-amino acid oxidase-like deaminating enzyme
MNNHPRVIVIGAGIIGASIAYRLSRRTPNVTVLDAAKPGMAASRASYAWMNARPKPPREYHALSRMGLDAWSRLERKLRGDIGITWGGEVRWAATDDGAAELRDEVALMQSWGYPIRMINADELRSMEPALAADPITAAAYGDAEGHVDNSIAIPALLGAAIRNGGTVKVDSPVDEFFRDGDQVTGVRTPTEELTADIVVLAAGYSTKDLAASVGLTYPQIESPGATVVTEPIDPIFQTVAAVHTPGDLPDPQMNFRQFPDGRVQVHGGTHFGSVGDTSVEDAEWMLSELEKFLPAIKGVAIDEWRRAMRPMPADGFPIIGFPSATPNLYLATMHSGVTLAAITGELAAMEIIDGARSDELDPFRYERFSDG